MVEMEEVGSEVGVFNVGDRGVGRMGCMWWCVICVDVAGGDVVRWDKMLCGVICCVVAGCDVVRWDIMCCGGI